jgi:hypothetical protein
MKKTDFVNPFELPGKWYKANFHTHTTTSDGELAPLEQVERYAEAGYQILNLSDHHATNDISEFADRKDIMVVSGMECHPECPDSLPYHIVAVNLPRDFEYDCKDATKCVKQIRDAGGVAILAHPHWNGHDLKEILAVKDVVALEVYNSSCDYSGRPCSESEWGQCFQNELYYGGIAADDCHWRGNEQDRTECDFGMGWTWIKMEELNVANLLKALRTGAYYASCGPEIKSFKIENGKVKLSCSEVEKVNFMANICGQGYRVWAPDGEVITEVELSLETRNMKNWPFVRCFVTDKFGKKAWTNPIFLT